MRLAALRMTVSLREQANEFHVFLLQSIVASLNGILLSNNVPIRAEV